MLLFDTWVYVSLVVSCVFVRVPISAVVFRFVCGMFGLHRELFTSPVTRWLAPTTVCILCWNVRKFLKIWRVVEWLVSIGFYVIKLDFDDAFVVYGILTPLFLDGVSLGKNLKSFSVKWERFLGSG